MKADLQCESRGFVLPPSGSSQTVESRLIAWKPIFLLVRLEVRLIFRTRYRVEETGYDLSINTNISLMLVDLSIGQGKVYLTLVKVNEREDPRDLIWILQLRASPTPH